MMTNAIELLAELNDYRAQAGLKAFADWRKARHMPMLEEYRRLLAEVADDESFEMPAEELAAQDGRPVHEDLEVVVIDSFTAFAEHANEVASTGGNIAKIAHSDDFAGHKALQEKARELAKEKSYKQVAHYDKSLVDKPVAFVHAFLDNNPGMTRKEAVIALTEGYGINYSTARTQYQRWFTEQKKGK